MSHQRRRSDERGRDNRSHAFTLSEGGPGALGADARAALSSSLRF